MEILNDIDYFIVCDKKNQIFSRRFSESEEKSIESFLFEERNRLRLLNKIFEERGYPKSFFANSWESYEVKGYHIVKFRANNQ